MAKGISENKIAIIGAGHMGTALYEGLLKSGVSKSRLILAKRGGNQKAARAARVIFICVKPGVVAEVLHEIRDEIKGKLVVSAAAAVSLAYIAKHAKGASVARIMPNIAVASNEGVVGILDSRLASREQASLRALLSGLGLLIEAKNDAELESLTLISGCGPGVAAFFIESLAESARGLGLKGILAETLAFQVFKGTLAHMEESGLSAKRLREGVATEGGITEMIISTLGKKGFKKHLRGALSAGRARIKKISK